MLKQVVMIALLVGALSGCSHVRVEEWSEDKVTACGNRWADAADFQETAQKVCGTRKPVEIGGGYRTTGFFAKTSGSETRAKNTETSCRVYECR